MAILKKKYTCPCHPVSSIEGGGGQSLVCKLNKSIYGLKKPLDNGLISSLKFYSYGFCQSKDEYTSFIRHQPASIILLLVSMDDIILAGNDLHSINDFKLFLDTQFKLKNLGSLTYFFGMEVARTTKVFLFVNVQTCTRYSYRCWTVRSQTGFLSYGTEFKIQQSDGVVVANLSMYRRLIGCLIYLTNTRPTLAFSVHILSQLMDQPRHPHLQSATQLLRCLKRNN